MTTSEPGCPLCGLVSAVTSSGKGLVMAEPEVVVMHLPQTGDDVYLGHLLVMPRSHVPSYGRLSPNQAGALGVALSRCGAALEGMGAERTYTYTIGHGTEHLHVNMVPRWPGTPDDVPWNTLSAWEGARRGGPDEVAETIEQLGLDD